ncbi:MAG TPA: hypothetical protein VLL52_16925 [Anaerolineae bacterium]|nr:hypothetical protein [Anaerolineae bacterium]
MDKQGLSEEERAEAVHLLSRSSQGGGWFLIFMGVFWWVLLGISWWGRPEMVNVEMGVGFTAMGLLFAAPGWWLVRHKKRIEGWLDGEVVAGTAVITSITPLGGYWGGRVKVEIKLPQERLREGVMRTVVMPDWEVGETLLIWSLPDGRFFLRGEKKVAADIGVLDTPERRATWRWRIGCGVLTWVLLSLLGIFLGLYGQGSLPWQ